jgi:hypothetical protein
MPASRNSNDCRQDACFPKQQRLQAGCPRYFGWDGLLQLAQGASDSSDEADRGQSRRVARQV